MHAVHEAAKPDVTILGRTLSRAFADDPVFGHFLPEDAKRRDDRLATFFTDTVRMYLRADKTVLTVPERTAASLWAPPGQWKTKPSDLLRSAPNAVRVFGARLPLALQTLTAMEKKHPNEPHWYLGVLGTEPAHQGHGLGAALMQPVLERCDREGLGAYLESSKEQNVPYYRRFGFEVTEEVRLPKGGPPVWLMWRDPQPDLIA